jgi:RNA polymerase sigma factor (sigma-70 family)
MDTNHLGGIRELVAAAADGDERAWETIIDRYSSAILARTRGFRLNAADTADVVQTVWLRFAESIATIREPAAIGGWLARTAFHECIRLNRRREYPCEMSDVLLIDESDGPEAIAMGWAEQATLVGALDRLSERDQTLLAALMESPNPSYTEISRALSMPVGSIGPTRGRALDRLRREYDALVA